MIESSKITLMSKIIVLTTINVNGSMAKLLFIPTYDVRRFFFCMFDSFSSETESYCTASSRELSLAYATMRIRLITQPPKLVLMRLNLLLPCYRTSSKNQMKRSNQHETSGPDWQKVAPKSWTRILISSFWHQQHDGEKWSPISIASFLTSCKMQRKRNKWFPISLVSHTNAFSHTYTASKRKINCCRDCCLVLTWWLLLFWKRWRSLCLLSLLGDGVSNRWGWFL